LLDKFSQPCRLCIGVLRRNQASGFHQRTFGAKITLAGDDRRQSLFGVCGGVFIETWEVIADF
jgi:hypothetical protein